MVLIGAKAAPRSAGQCSHCPLRLLTLLAIVWFQVSSRFEFFAILRESERSCLRCLELRRTFLEPEGWNFTCGGTRLEVYKSPNLRCWSGLEAWTLIMRRSTISTKSWSV